MAKLEEAQSSKEMSNGIDLVREFGRIVAGDCITHDVSRHREMIGLIRAYLRSADSYEQCDDDGWISVESELPLNNSIVLAHAGGRRELVHYVESWKEWRECFLTTSTQNPVLITGVTHWMPEPRPPLATEANA